MPPPPPLALSPALPSELLTYVLTHKVYPTTLIICQPRNTFLTSLLSSIPQPIQRQPPPPDSSPFLEEDPEQENSLHPLLIPTLHQIATSRSINLVFIPTVSHLRAYISVFPTNPEEKEKESTRLPEQKFDNASRNKNGALLIVYGVVELHRDTSEWSAQGLGNSVSGIVEAGFRSGVRVEVVEEKRDDEEYVDVEEEDGGELNRRGKDVGKVWEERVPMLNGSVRRAGFESEDSAWSGRTIEVGRIFARWFRFGKGDWDME